MQKKILISLLTITLCVATTIPVFAAENSTSSDIDLSISANSDKLSNNTNYTETITDATSPINFSESKEISASDVKIKNSINEEINSELSTAFTNQNSSNFSKSPRAIAATDEKPIANLKYVVLNPDSLKDGQITTDTQIAWLWSYNGEEFTYDPNGLKITNLNLDGIPSINDYVLGNLEGNIGFATQFDVAGQYILKFKCMNENNVWSDEWSIFIDVEPSNDNTRPECTVTYNPNGYTNSPFSFSWDESKDNDVNDSITSAEGLVEKDGKFYSLSNYLTAVNGSSCTARFPQTGEYKVYLRVGDSNNAWSNWAIMKINVFTPLNTPGNISASDVWSKILANSNNPTSQEAFRRSIPKSSKYAFTSVDESGNFHDFYTLVLEDKYKATSNNYLTQYDTYLIYDNNFITSHQYSNGYYGTWYPLDSLSLYDGVMSADLGFKKYSFTDFGDYKRLHIFDFYTHRDYTVEYANYGRHPYNIFTNLITKNQIVYGQAAWYSDGSGHSFLTRIDRNTGKKITNEDIIFGSYSEISNGTMLDNNTFQYHTNKKGGYTYTIDINTLSIISKVAD